MILNVNTRIPRESCEGIAVGGDFKLTREVQSLKLFSSAIFSIFSEKDAYCITALELYRQPCPQPLPLSWCTLYLKKAIYKSSHPLSTIPTPPNCYKFQEFDDSCS